MSVTVTSDEERILREHGKKYESQGYTVSYWPHERDLPVFLRNWATATDAIAVRGQEMIVIGVSAKSDRDKPRHIGEMAKEIARHPGVGLDVVWAGKGAIGEPEGFVVPTGAEIMSKLSEIEALYRNGGHDAAFLLVWSLLEAATRRAAAGQGSVIAGRREAIALAKELVALGIIGQDEYERLVPLATLRNAIAHGGVGVEVAKKDFQDLTALVTRVLEEGSAEPSDRGR